MNTPLHGSRVRATGGGDLALVCETCGLELCYVEDKDTLDVIVGFHVDHGHGECLGEGVVLAEVDPADDADTETFWRQNDAGDWCTYFVSQDDTDRARAAARAAQGVSPGQNPKAAD